MKLLYITNGINGSGGLERVLAIKSSYLVEHYGYEVSILVLNNAHENPFYEFNEGIKFYSIDVGGNPLQYWKSYKRGIQKIVDEIQPHVISVCDDGLKGFFIPNFIKRKSKIIYERHASIQLNTNSSLKGKWIKTLMQKQVKKFDRFVVLTNSNIKEWKSDNVIAIWNPLSFHSETQSSLQNKKIIAVGSQSFNKGYDTLLECWADVENEFPGWELNIFGQPDKNKQFIHLAATMKLKNVNFHLPVSNIKSRYLESSVMVLPSRSEGFGMVLTEAMECGLPCVSFDCPSGPRDIIKNNEDGFLVEDQNKEEFTAKMKILMKDENLRKKFGKNAKENVKRFSPEIIIREWDELFNELIR